MNEYPDMATVEVGDELPSMDKRAGEAELLSLIHI